MANNVASVCSGLYLTELLLQNTSFLEFVKVSGILKKCGVSLILKMLKYHTLDGKLKSMLETIR